MSARIEFRSNEQNLRVALMQMPIPIGVTNSNGDILLLNEAFSVAFGYRIEEINSVDEWMKLVYPDPGYRADVIKIWDADITESLRSGSPTPRREYQITTRDGQVKRVIIMMRKVEELLFTTFEDVTQSRRDEEALAEYRSQLELLAYHDPLLHLPNRHRFAELVEQAVQQTGERTLALWDIDDFSSINNALGHQFGDQVLVAVAERLASNLPEGVLLARVSSDCFGIIGFDEQVNPDVLRGIFADPLPIANETLRISATTGLVRLDRPSLPGSELIKDAELALRYAKLNHRGKAKYFTSDMITQPQERMRLLVGLRNAFEENQLFVVYQPQVVLADDRVIGMEALIRWRTSSGEFIRPDQFIPIAEHSGLIVPIGDFVLRTSLRYLRELHTQGFNHLCMSVNVSIVQLREPDFLTNLRKVLFETEVEPKFVELEVTESMAMSDIGFMKDVLTELRKLGVSIAIDDFGTGYSSLGVLRQLPVQRLKIDKSFVDRIVDDSQDRAIIQMIIELTKQLKLDVIAEGVETMQQKHLLAEMGCSQGQGYLFARPMVSDQLEQWLAIGTVPLGS